jgi:myo-inositol-1(or 4)-monophosphatase
METMDWSRELAVAQEAAEAAAAILRSGWGQRPSFACKSSNTDLVTDFDRRAESAVLGVLTGAFPDDGITAEESGRRASGSGRTWHVDPLDGTTNFSHGLPLFSVSIALYQEGSPRAAAVVAPALGWEFAAARGQGATCNGGPLRVSATGRLDDALLVTGFPYDRRESADNNFRRFEALAQLTHGVRRLGSAALDLCFVARGWLDGYWEHKLKPWDIAAGVLIAAEAGARLTAFDGGPLAVERGEVVATNGLIHDELLGVLGRVP